MVRRVPVTSEDHHCATAEDSWALSRESEGTGLHMTGDDNFPCRGRPGESDRKVFFFLFHRCSALTSEHMENGIGRGVTNCMTCPVAVNTIGCSRSGRCSGFRAQKRNNKTCTSYETCAIMFITSERSGRNCVLFNIVAWQKHFRSLISRSMSLRYAVVPSEHFSYRQIGLSHNCTHSSADNSHMSTGWTRRCVTKLCACVLFLVRLCRFL